MADYNQNELPNLISLRHIAVALGVSVSAARSYMSNPTAPNPIKLGTRKLLWVQAEVISWLESNRTSELQQVRNPSYSLLSREAQIGAPNKGTPKSRRK